MKTVILLGSSGLTGNNLLQKLILDPSYSKVILINRSPLNIKNEKVIEILTDFKSEITLDSINKIDSIFSCLGTTRKKTPDLDTYRSIEIEIPCEIAKIALKKGLQNFHFISSVGADSNSSNFYLKIKGEAETSLKALNIPCLHLYRPSLLIGQRKENRIAEKIFMAIMPVFNPLLFGQAVKYRSMLIENLTKSMIAFDQNTAAESTEIHEYRGIMQSIA